MPTVWAIQFEAESSFCAFLDDLADKNILAEETSYEKDQNSL